MSFCWVTPGLGLKIVPGVSRKEQTGVERGARARCKQAAHSPVPTQPPAALPEEGKSFTPMFTPRGWRVPRVPPQWHLVGGS